MSDSGSFELERMLRQNAHEKAFEINVLAQRQFEKYKNNTFQEGKKHALEEQKKKIQDVNQELNIARSKKINAARLKKMIERNDCLLEIKKEMITKLQEEMTNNRERYLETLQNLILQSMIKLLEPSLKIRCREEDVADIEGFTKDIEEKYHSFMLE